MILISLLLGCSGSAPPPAPPPRTDVLLITLDTTRADALGAYGNQRGATPNLDALAEEGALFTRAYTVTPLTIPAHSSIMTGLLPPRHGVRDNGDFFLSDDATTLAERFKAAGYRTMASVGAEVTSHHWGFAQGFDTYYDDMGAASDDSENRWRVERRGDRVLADALGWLDKNSSSEQPFFAWVHLYDAHHPYAAPEPFASRYADQPYLAEVAWTDSLVGTLLSWLRDHGALEHTAVLVTGDHGEGLGSHGEAFHGVLLYDATTHIPMIVRPPGGLPAPGVVPFPVSLVDLAPTALSLAHQAVPEGLDGMDLSPWLAPRAAMRPPPVDRAVYAEALYGWRHYGWAPLRALVTDDAKLIDSTTPELYARGDLFEAQDLSKTASSQVQSLSGRLRSLYAGLSPQSALSSKAELSDEQLGQLEALGYVTSGAAPTGDGFDQGLPDAVAHLPALRRLEEARAAVQKRDLPAAETLLRALIKDEPGLSEAQNMLATALARQGKVDEGLAILRAIDARQPSSNLKVAMGGMCLRSGRLSEARGLLAEAVDEDPYLEAAWSPYLLTLFLLGDLDDLGRQSARALQEVPELPAGQVAQGVLKALHGQSVAAETLLRRAAAREPLTPLLNYGLGLAAAGQGRADEAETAFLEEIRVMPPAVYARRELVKIYAGQHRYEDQIAQLEVIQRFQPRDASNHQSRAQALYNLGRYAEAETEVEACLTDAPKYGPCKMLQANALKRLGRPAEAEAAYQEALQMARAQRPAR